MCEKWDVIYFILSTRQNISDILTYCEHSHYIFNEFLNAKLVSSKRTIIVHDSLPDSDVSLNERLSNHSNSISLWVLSLTMEFPDRLIQMLMILTPVDCQRFISDSLFHTIKWNLLSKKHINLFMTVLFPTIWVIFTRKYLNELL